jgi:hypothetical protein
MKNLIIEAFDEARDQFSVDRVIADPDLNARFVTTARRYGLKEAPVELGGLERSTRRTVIRNQDAYAFASEIAIRTLDPKQAYDDGRFRNGAGRRLGARAVPPAVCDGCVSLGCSFVLP